MIEKFFTTEQVANILQVHPFTILKFIKNGKLKGIKLGRVYRIKESDVKEFLEERMTRSGEQRSVKSKPPAPEEEEIKSPTRTPGTPSIPKIHYEFKKEKSDEGDPYYVI